jgi:hypothetical protein
MAIESATITIHGDPSVGIQDQVIQISGLGLQTWMFESHETGPVVEELRTALIAVGKAINPMDVSVFIHGWDEEEPEEGDEPEDGDDYDDSMDGDHESALASAGLGTDENYGCFGGDDGW